MEKWKKKLPTRRTETPATTVYNNNTPVIITIGTCTYRVSRGEVRTLARVSRVKNTFSARHILKTRAKIPFYF